MLESRQEDEVTAHVYSGEWVHRNRSVFLLYEEGEEGESELARTTVRWNEKELKITRRGAVQSEQTFVPGVRRLGEYNSQGMRFAMETVTHALTFTGGRETSGNGQEAAEPAAFRLPVTVGWSYTLWMDNQQIGRFQIRLRIQEVDE